MRKLKKLLSHFGIFRPASSSSANSIDATIQPPAGGKNLHKKPAVSISADIRAPINLPEKVETNLIY